uniref:hypothetical protein n=1 Tax=Aliarcobacter sp. TaxID=2321116 RepID=UPI0040485E14
MSFELLKDFIIFGYVLNVVGFSLNVVFAIYTFFYREDIVKFVRANCQEDKNSMKVLFKFCTPYLLFITTIKVIYILSSNLTDEEKVNKLNRYRRYGF